MSMPLAQLLFYLTMTVYALIVRRFVDPIGGRGLAKTVAMCSVLSAGMWLVSVGYVWVGSALSVLGCATILMSIWRAGRDALIANAPLLLLCGGAIAAILITELASWLGATREVQRALLVVVGATTVAFLGWIILSTVRLTIEYFRQTR